METEHTPQLPAQRFSAESEAAARDLHGILRSMDPARWKDEGAPRLRVELDDLAGRMARLAELEPLEGAEGEVAARLAELSALIARGLPSPGLSTERLRAAWAELRSRLVPAYESLAKSLSSIQVDIPSLRPTNYARNVYHVVSGLVVLAITQLYLPGWKGILVAGSATITAWSLEISRRYSPAINNACMKAFGAFAHPHEAWRINSATWFTTALFGLSLLPDRIPVTVAMAILASGDPAAAVIGRRFGRIRLANGRSLEGALAFVGASLLVGLPALLAFYPGLGFATGTALVLAGAIPAALAELFTRKIDDNLAIPWAAAAGCMLAQAAFGV